MAAPLFILTRLRRWLDDYADAERAWLERWTLAGMSLPRQVGFLVTTALVVSAIPFVSAWCQGAL